MPQRKHPQHGVLPVEGQPTIIFDTVCTRGRNQWLACEAVHLLLRAVWLEADAWRVGRYVLMPDHVHYFAAATNSPIDFGRWTRFWKGRFTKQFGRPDCRWQTDHWDTRIRSFDAYEEKWRYILENPVRRGLVKVPGDWPYSGEIHTLRWD